MRWGWNERRRQPVWVLKLMDSRLAMLSDIRLNHTHTHMETHSLPPTSRHPLSLPPEARSSGFLLLLQLQSSSRGQQLCSLSHLLLRFSRLICQQTLSSQEERRMLRAMSPDGTGWRVTRVCRKQQSQGRESGCVAAGVAPFPLEIPASICSPSLGFPFAFTLLVLLSTAASFAA